jgi:hypothetical protein
VFKLPPWEIAKVEKSIAVDGQLGVAKPIQLYAHSIAIQIILIYTLCDDLFKALHQHAQPVSRIAWSCPAAEAVSTHRAIESVNGKLNRLPGGVLHRQRLAQIELHHLIIGGDGIGSQQQRDQARQPQDHEPQPGAVAA